MRSGSIPAKYKVSETRGTNFLYRITVRLGRCSRNLGYDGMVEVHKLEKSSSRKVGSVTPLFDEVLLERHQMFIRSLQKIKIERENNACVEVRNPNMAVAPSLSSLQGARLRELN